MKRKHRGELDPLAPPVVSADQYLTVNMVHHLPVYDGEDIASVSAPQCSVVSVSLPTTPLIQATPLLFFVFHDSPCQTRL